MIVGSLFLFTTLRHSFLRSTALTLSVYREYLIAEEDRLGHSAATPVHRSGFIRRTVRQ